MLAAPHRWAAGSAGSKRRRKGSITAECSGCTALLGGDTPREPQWGPFPMPHASPTHLFASAGVDAPTSLPTPYPLAAASPATACAARQRRHSSAGALDGNRDSRVAMSELRVTRRP